MKTMKKIFSFINEVIWEPLFWIVVILIAVFFLAKFMLNISYQNKIEKQKFMEQCTQDKKEYECTYLWRISKREDNSVIAMPIVTPVITR